MTIYKFRGIVIIGISCDAWGNILSTGGTMASTLGAHNPFRYRSYVYDQETGLYYLQSRYYNPEICRFISADALLGANQNVISYNLFVYCGNNPVNYSDPSGYFAITISMLISGIAIAAGIGAGFGFCATVISDLDNGALFDGDMSFSAYLGNTLGGGIAGAGIGICTVLGSGWGVAIATKTALTVAGVTLTGGSTFAIAAGSAFALGGLGYTLRTTISDRETFEMVDMFIDATANMTSGILTFLGATGGGILGLRIPGVVNLKNTILYQSGLVCFGIYPVKAIISFAKGIFKEAY